MELVHVIIKSGPSPRPLAWSLEVSSSENEDWKMISAFGDKEHCRKLWDLRPERRRRKARAAKNRRADKPTCSTQFTSPRPLENGEMHIRVQEVAARRVRISFRAAHPASPSQYYTVRALALVARCLCHAHARHCHVDKNGAKCKCLHGTCGAHCSRPCETPECSCGERGACQFDETGAILCVNCTENRAGPLCDRCLTGFYNAVPDGPCLPCECDPDGSDGSCTYSKHQKTCNCFLGFTGPLCDACADENAVFPYCLVTELTTGVPECKCDVRGVVDPERVCDDVCDCKVGKQAYENAVFPYCLVTELTTGVPECKCDVRGVVDPGRVCDDVCDCKVGKQAYENAVFTYCLVTELTAGVPECKCDVRGVVDPGEVCDNVCDCQVGKQAYENAMFPYCLVTELNTRVPECRCDVRGVVDPGRVCDDVCDCKVGKLAYKNVVFPYCLVTELTTGVPECKCDVRGVVDPGRVCDDVCDCKVGKLAYKNVVFPYCLVTELTTGVPECKCDVRGVVDPGRVCDDVCDCKVGKLAYENAVFPYCLVTELTTGVPECKCDIRGILNPGRVCEDICECKENVVGERCDACAPGHFGLRADLPEGCRPCYCAHVTDSCVEDPQPGDNMVFPLGEAWLVSDAEANETIEPSVENGKPFLISSYEVELWDSFYWLTTVFKGEQLSSYGAEIRAALFFGVVRGDTGGNPTAGPDAILIGADGTKLYFSNRTHETPGELVLNLPLLEGHWFTSEGPVSRTQLMDVLSDLKAIMIRAHFHMDQDEVRLDSVQILGAGAGARETCACPPGYAGAHCTRCAWTHARVARARDSLPAFECVPCACNGHAGCDDVEGACGPCKHNTTGAHCERCLPGHYGNPVQGACKPCACPLYLPSNNFSPNCALASAEGDEFVCTQCPDGYTGDHCEHCDFGYWGSPTTPGGSCQPCDCGGAPCDRDTGLCGTCPPRTEGARCDQCQGIPANLVTAAERPATATRDCVGPALLAQKGRAVIRTFGCWGSPTTPGGSCQPCDCGGAPCDRDTGLCETCPPRTEGARCDQCQEGYWFGPDGWSGAGCVPCDCGAGALSVACDAKTGQCACKQGFTGRRCDTCSAGHGGKCGPAARSLWHATLKPTSARVNRASLDGDVTLAAQDMVVNLTAGCPACRCGTASLSNSCAADTGVCACAPGAAPPYCDSCQDEHYGLESSGCKGCNCSPLGSESSVCDIRSGQCRCRPHVTGRACDTCEEGYWGLREGGCRPCQCGAGAAACDPVTGQCACAQGVGGDSCDRCLRGYYGFGPNGCLPCPPCTDGKVCSPENGRCVCPPRSRGPGCKQCAPGFWARPAGCKRCSCGPGATSDTCDPLTGQCKCRAGWSGASCDVCALGHFGPRCKPCHCHPDGSAQCENGACGCDDNGQCFCKANVVGEKCDQCRPGTFGLSASPTGCTECFCFGRSAHCTQAGLTRAALHAAAPAHLTLLQGDSIKSVDQDSLIAIHTHSLDSTITLPWPPVPVYMELDRRFLGDRVTSYGGFLRFRVEEEGGEGLDEETMRRFPLVRVYGRDVVLDYYERTPPINNTHGIRLHESLWRVRARNDLQATRAALMLGLRKVERILVRVTTRAPKHDDNVHALLLNVSLDTAIPGFSRSEPALGVELCSCPPGYSAPSCHEPAIGFWMPPVKVHLDSVAGTIVIRLEGDAKPCDCNGRAVSCDPDTGHCVNCTHGTGGPRCDRCAEGHHGAPDAPGGCQACPCPSRARNFASACAMQGGRLQCLCKPGYAGTDCELCAASYYRLRDGACAPCACDVAGSLSPQCDGRGRCRCRDFATGDKCDRCRGPKLWMDGGGCRPCDDCTTTLLDSIDHLASSLRSADLTELSRIPQPYPAVREYSHNTSLLRNSLHHFINTLDHSRNLGDDVSNLEASEHRIFTDLHALKEDASTKEDSAKSLSLESMSGLEEVLKQRQKLGEQVAVLDDFARGERHLGAHRVIKEARHLLRNIKDVRLNDYIAGANDVYDAANVQSTAVQELNYSIDDAYARLRGLQNTFESWHEKAEDLPRLADAVWMAGDKVAAMEKEVRPRMAAARDTGLRCRLILEDVLSLSNHTFVEDVGSALLRARSLLLSLPALAAELASLTPAAEEKEGILYNLTPAYKQKYLDAVERHVNELGAKAREYKSLFAGTRALASSGVTAARAWAEVAGAVRAAAAHAHGAAAAAAGAAKMAPMMGSADQAKQASSDQKIRAAEVLSKAEELRRQLDHLRRGADLVSVVLRGLGWQERDLGARPSARVAQTIAAANEQADRVFATTRVLYDEASEIRRRVRYNLRRQLTELQRHGDTALGAAQEHVSQIRGNMLRGSEAAEALAAAAAARAKEHERAAGLVRPRLQELQDKIARAKHAADSVRHYFSLLSPITAMQASLRKCPAIFRVEAKQQKPWQQQRQRERKSTSEPPASLGLDCRKVPRDLSRGSEAAEALGAAAAARAKEHERAAGLVRPRLQELQDKIARAKHAADSITVSVTSLPGGIGCSRAFTAPATSPAVSRASIAVSFDGAVRDGPLLQMTDENKETPSYMKLSVQKQKFQLTWDLGDGAGIVTHPEVLEHIHDDADHNTYTVDIERVWNTVRLTVERAGKPSTTVSNATLGSSVSLHATRLWLGGGGGGGLPGCVHALYCDERRVGLWNFVEQPKEAQCTGCTQRWYNSARGGEPSLAWFNGEGYAELKRSGFRPSDRRYFSVAFTVRTRDQDALLFMALDVANNRSISVRMSSCRVVFAVQYSDARLEIAARGRHCHGRAVHVQAARVFASNKLEKGSLRVNGEETLGSPSPPVQAAAALPDVSGAAYWLGGAPPGHDAPAPPLLGCLGALSVDREGYDVLDTPTRNGVEARCMDRTLRTATLEGTGYVELPSPILRRKAALGLTFRSRGDGLLLYRAPSTLSENEVDDEDGDDKHYLRLVLVDGELELTAAAGKAELRLRTNGTRFDDDNRHSVRIVRAHKQLELWVDEDRLATGTLAGNALPARNKGLFIGGMPAAQDGPMYKGFSGTVADLIVDSNVVGFETATASYTVEVGAVKFGDSPGSHATLRLPPRVKELSLSLSFRTFAPDGLLLLAPGTKTKPKHYMALLVREGKLRLYVRGRRRKELSLAASVSDGEWREVTVRISRNRLVLSSGGAASAAHAPPAARAPRLYVGGLPQPLNNIPNSILRVGGFLGCIRRVVVNDRAEDLVRNAAAHHRVGQCFPNVERGAYFGGDAYALWSSAWRPGESGAEAAEMRLRFRSAEPSGLLLAATNLVLELKDGAVSVNLYELSGERLVVILTRSGSTTSLASARGPGNRALCDGRWHSVLVRVARAHVALALDAGPEIRDGDATLVDEESAPAAPLYVGGLPEGSTDGVDAQNFKGCIDDVSIGGQKRKWKDMEALHNVLLDSCPVTQ
ncbi:laminin subunit alpha-2-like [Cydia fagiglandana]|uniref:laminin subunit alpha-2-like n=1 Tax=Cydia fagiglandana TaxID=1458189 RepID=UPI002FEE4B61